MGERVWRSPLAALVVCAALLDPGAMPAAPVAVRHAEGLVHGFLVLRTVAGASGWYGFPPAKAKRPITCTRPGLKMIAFDSRTPVPLLSKGPVTHTPLA